MLMLTEDENTKLLQYVQVSRTGVRSIINNQRPRTTTKTLVSDLAK